MTTTRVHKSSTRTGTRKTGRTKVETPKTKVCTGSGKRLPIDKFPKDSRSPDGYGTRSIEWVREYTRKWRDGQSKAWKAREKERVRLAVAKLRRRRKAEAKAR